MIPRVGPFLTPGAWLAGFIKRTTRHCNIQNMKALGLVVSEKIFLCFSYDAPGVGPIWTPGALLAGFIKRNTIHCYKQNIAKVSKAHIPPAVAIRGHTTSRQKADYRKRYTSSVTSNKNIFINKKAKTIYP